MPLLMFWLFKSVKILELLSGAMLVLTFWWMGGGMDRLPMSTDRFGGAVSRSDGPENVWRYVRLAGGSAKDDT